jgi:hypothetical protein
MNLIAFPIDMVWPHIVKNICELRYRFEKYSDWTVQEVFYACESKKAVIFKSDSDGSFAIVKLKDGNDGEKVLFIWIAFIENGKREYYFDCMKKIARDLGATKMSFQSPRVGWDKDPLWKRTLTTYETEV